MGYFQRQIATPNRSPGYGRPNEVRSGRQIWLSPQGKFCPVIHIQKQLLSFHGTLPNLRLNLNPAVMKTLKGCFWVEESFIIWVSTYGLKSLNLHKASSLSKNTTIPGATYMSHHFWKCPGMATFVQEWLACPRFVPAAKEGFLWLLPPLDLTFIQYTFLAQSVPPLNDQGIATNYTVHHCPIYFHQRSTRLNCSFCSLWEET